MKEVPSFIILIKSLIPEIPILYVTNITLERSRSLDDWGNLRDGSFHRDTWSRSNFGLTCELSRIYGEGRKLTHSDATRMIREHKTDFISEALRFFSTSWINNEDLGASLQIELIDTLAEIELSPTWCLELNI